MTAQSAERSILPCPWCGADPKLSYDRDNDENWIACENDACDVAPSCAGPGIKQVTEWWNRRTPDGTVGEPSGYAVIMDDAPEKGQFTYVMAYTKREHAEELLGKCRGGRYRVEPIYFGQSSANSATRHINCPACGRLVDVEAARLGMPSDQSNREKT